MSILARHKRNGIVVRGSLWLISLAFSFCVPVALADNSDAAQISSNHQLDKLENKFFQHNYPKESMDERLSRVEKMVFGENQKGGIDERLNALLKAVPNLDSDTDVAKENSANSSPNAANNPNTASNNDSDNAGVGSYPAVAAMETKLLGKDYTAEPIKSRLERLEKKVLGKASTSDDLSERVDKLKEATGIDVARKPGSSSDWVEDEDLLASPPTSSGGGSGAYGFGNQDAYQDLQKSYGTPYGSSSRYPNASPYFPDQPTRTKNPISIKSFGLSQQVAALEHEIFNKTYDHDPLPARLNRLEANVFPDRKPAVDKPLPQRVQNLLAKVPISQKALQELAQANQMDTSQDLNQGGIDLSDPDNYGAAATQQSRGNLSKIINSLGNMLSGGMVGGFPTTGGNYVMDPQTGMLIDPSTGAMINPNTGMRYGGNNTYGNNMYGMGSSGSYGMGGSAYGMGSGFAPMGLPYGGMGGMGGGMGGMMNPGFGGMGMGFGFR